MAFESQHFDENFTAVSEAWTQRNKVFTFTNTVEAVIHVELRIQVAFNSPAYCYIDDVVISTNQVTVYWKYWFGNADKTAYASIDICVTS